MLAGLLQQSPMKLRMTLIVESATLVINNTSGMCKRLQHGARLMISCARSLLQATSIVQYFIIRLLCHKFGFKPR